MLPVARALADAGHEVLFACPESAADQLRRRGFEVAAFDDADPTPEQERMFEEARRTGNQDFAEEAVGLGFGLLWPQVALPRLEETWRRFRPDLVVRDMTEFAGSVLAERDGVASVVAMGGLQSIFRDFRRFFAPPLARLREQRGLDGDGPMLRDELILTTTPESFDIASGESPEVVRFRATASPTTGRDSGGASVYGTLGTEVMRNLHGPRLLATMTEAFGGLEASALITTGVEVPADELPAIPDNVEVRTFAAHAEVIPASRVVVHHGGAGTLHDVLAAGKPMAVLPQFADQFMNGARAEEVGVGRTLVGEQQTAENLMAAVEEVLDGRFDARAGAIAEEIARLPEVGSLVGRLRDLP